MWSQARMLQMVQPDQVHHYLLLTLCESGKWQPTFESLIILEQWPCFKILLTTLIIWQFHNTYKQWFYLGFWEATFSYTFGKIFY